MRRTVVKIEIRAEHDVVFARQRAKQIAAGLGFDLQDQTRLATAVSEVARNAYQYAAGGAAEFAVSDGAPPVLWVTVTDAGPGIANLRAVLDGTYQSRTGMGLGLVGTRRLVDQFEIESSPGATRVTVGKSLPKGAAAPTPRLLAEVAERLAAGGPPDTLQEFRQQNLELLQTLESLRARQAEVERLNEELAETNRGVLALYAELDDKAQELRKASEMKTRFLSNMTHELRTPLNSMILLSRLMLKEKDGPLGAEYRTQATFIAQSAESLLELVNDLLDLAKIEAGKMELRAARFTVEELMSGLRGMFRPMVADRDVELVFAVDCPEVVMNTDAAKLSQVLRNLISNALKFTERGEVRVGAMVAGAAAAAGGDGVVFTISDTGIGISPEGQKRLFQDFAQLRDEYKRGIQGTGLGLSISRQLADRMGGRIELTSTPGVGSTFRVYIPLELSEPVGAGAAAAAAVAALEENRG